MIDMILNDRITEEINKDNEYLLNTSQTGFRKKMGCELNILRLTETIQ